jgi:alpha,alpha-trehalase
MPGFHPHVLRDYALIADGERGALVSPRGDIVWMCAPRWDCDAVFSSLIGGGGVYAVTPARTFVWGGYYEEGTLIWRSRWITASGVTECREALAFPGDPGRVVVLRQIVARTCPAEVEIVLDLRAGFGRHGLRSIKHNGDGSWTGRAGDLHVRWSGDVAQARVHRAGPGSALTLNLTVPAGDSRDLVLELSAGPLRDDPADPARLWSATREQ